MENKDLINRAIRYIQSKPRSMLSLQEIADSAGFSLNYFDTMFMRHTGFSAVQYARIFKLTRAAVTLRTTKMTILDIALDYGYENPENFTRAFGAYYGVSPSGYRKKHQDIPLTWHDLSGKTIVGRFAKYLPHLRPVPVEYAIDSTVIHGRPVYDAELTEMQMAENGVFTFDESDEPKHFIVVEDYGNDVFTLDVIGGDEDCAIEYLSMAKTLPKVRIGFTLAAEDEFPKLQKALVGYACELLRNFEFLDLSLPEARDTGYSMKLLSKEDIPAIETLGEACACKTAVKGLAAAFNGTMNNGLMALGLFEKGKLSCMALPAIHRVRDLSFLDIGEIYISPDFACDIMAMKLWDAVTQYALSRGHIPAAFRVPDQSPYMNKGFAQRAGYTCISRFKSARLG